MPNTLFGRYEIRHEIGRGGMAHVYLAFDPTFRREVAVKVLPPHYLENPLLRARFEREARLIAAIEHPAIVPVYDFGEQEGQLYLVMRYMPGGSLAERIRQGPFTLAQASAILSQLAPALDAVHARDIVHRDLKPGNILLDSFGNPALSDFGIAHLSEATVNLTGDAIIGTPSYMSPEQVRGEETLDGRSDLYALGIILFEMLTGYQPYRAGTPMSVAMRHLTDPVPQICLACPELPEGIQAVLDRALAKDRELRYRRAADLAFDVRTLLETLPASADQPSVNSGPESPVSPISTAASARAAATAETELTGKPVKTSQSQAATEIAAATATSEIPQAKQLFSLRRGQLIAVIGAGILIVLLSFFGLRAWLSPPLMTPTPAVSPTPFFVDDFATPANGWPVGDQGSGSYSYQDGAYLITVRENGSLFWAVPEITVSDQQLQVEGARVSGDQGYYGLICRLQDGGDYYYFIIRPDGYYTIGKYLAEAFIPLTPGGWTLSSAIQPGSAPNLLQAHCSGDRLSLSVNGVFVEEVNDSSLSGGRPGLIAAALDNQEFLVQFDEFSVISVVP